MSKTFCIFPQAELIFTAVLVAITYSQMQKLSYTPAYVNKKDFQFRRYGSKLKKKKCRRVRKYKGYNGTK